MNITETSPAGAYVLEHKQSIIIGVSINNSYFTRDNLVKLIRFAGEYANQVYVMIPDEPSVFTLIAKKGYSQEKATKKARLAANALETKCREIASEHGIEIKIVRWGCLNSNAEYVISLGEITSLYYSNTEFRASVRDTTEKVLARGIDTVLQSSLDTGANFVLQELAFIARSNLILQQSACGYLYHSTMVVLEALIMGLYPQFVIENVGYITAQ